MAERRDGDIAQPLDVAAARDVGRHDNRARAGAPGHLLKRGLAARRQRNTVAGSAQLCGERRANSAARARDHHMLC